MFRLRKHSSSTDIITSSLSSGNASIRRKDPAIDERRHTIIQESFADSGYNPDEIIDLQAPSTNNNNELTIESMSAVIAAAVQISSAGGTPSSLSLGNASILKPLSNKTNSSCTSNDSTSKELPGNNNNDSLRRKFSRRLFSNPWSTSKKSNSSFNNSGTTSPVTPSTPSLDPSNSPFDSNTEDENSECGSPRSSTASFNKTSTPVIDDGRDELTQRGIQFKEIKTTLKPLVISDEARFPMPHIKLERPGFARVSY